MHAKPDGAPSASGFDNLEVTPILEVARSEEHEFIASLAFSWEIGGTGSRSIGAEAASGYTPKIEFGKGFGPLPRQRRLAAAVCGDRPRRIRHSRQP